MPTLDELRALRQSIVSPKIPPVGRSNKHPFPRPSTQGLQQLVPLLQGLLGDPTPGYYRSELLEALALPAAAASVRGLVDQAIEEAVLALKGLDADAPVQSARQALKELQWTTRLFAPAGLRRLGEELEAFADSQLVRLAFASHSEHCL